MSAQLNAELKIPDLWFDFYARFLPGTMFVSALYLLWPGKAGVPSGGQAAILALWGYIVGLLAQPPSSELTGLLHYSLQRKITGDTDYVDKQEHLDPRRVLSKMHDETTFFVQCFSLSAVLLVLQNVHAFQLGRTKSTIIVNVLFLPVFPLAATDVSWRRVRRARRLNRLSRT